MSRLRVEPIGKLTAVSAETDPCAWTCSRARAREAFTSTIKHTEQELDLNHLESNLNIVQDMREEGHRPGDPGDQEAPLPQPEEHGHDVGNGAVACAPGEQDGPAGEDPLAGDLARPAGTSREQMNIGKKLSRIIPLTGEHKSLLAGAMSQGEQRSGVAGVVAREVERLNELTEQEATGSGKKRIRVVKVAGRGSTKAKRKEGEMNCSRIEDMIARMGGTSKRKVEMGEELSVSKRRMMGE